MGLVLEEFHRQLAELSTRHAGNPRGEMLELFLMSLEREEIVSVAYRASLIAERVGRMKIPADVADVIRHALLWAWKDEEMHAVYIRGLLFSLGGPWLRAVTVARQLAGATGGWAASVAQHVPWSVAPVSRAIAAGLTAAGRVAGLVPADVSRELRWLPFAAFCRFNIDGELTAHECWRRVAELARTQSDLTPDVIASFDRIVLDEDRHRQVFEILSTVADESDSLAPGVAAEDLVGRLKAVSEFFVPLAQRGCGSEPDPVGRGGLVAVTEAPPGKDKRAAFREHLQAAGLAELVAARTAALGRAPAVAIKPTFMLAYDRRDPSVYTDPELVDELAAWLRERGVTDVAVVESPNLYGMFFQNRTVADVAKYCGYTSDRYRIVDLAAEQEPHPYTRGMAVNTVGRTWRDAGLRIVFGKLRSHPVHLAHLNVGNLDSIGARAEGFLFFERRAQLDTTILMTLEDHPPHFALLDGFDAAAHGLCGVIGCPQPIAPRRLYGGADTLAVDLVAARACGVTSPQSSSMLDLATQWFGDPRGQTQVVGPDVPIAGWRHPHASGWTRLLSLLAFPVFSIGSGRGSLFVPEMDPAAFPPIERETASLSLARRAVRRLVGLARP